MARTIATIYNEIAASKDSQSALADLAPSADDTQQLLDDLNSSSRVAIWRLWGYLMAVAIHTHEVLWDLFRKEVEVKAANAVVGTAQWYQSQVFAYQHGDSLVYDSTTGRYGYADINTAVRIVERCAVVETAQGLVFKVAKLDGNDLEGLTLAESQALAGYIKKIRFAGTRFQVVSGEGDILKVEATVYYDPIRTQVEVQGEVEAAINLFIGNLPFDGELLLSKLVDAVQAVEGVLDFTLGSIETKQSVVAAYTIIDRNHIPFYGYYIVSPASGETLADTITYIA